MSFSGNNNPLTSSCTKQIDPKLDAMFSGLGLDNYFNSSPSHAPAVSESPKEVTASGLSLQEKQRYDF